MANQRLSVHCPRHDCTGRLFLDSEYQGRRLVRFWHCLSCSREWGVDGRPRSFHNGEERPIDFPLALMNVR